MDKHQPHNIETPAIAIYFEDRTINMLFSSLLESRGVSTRIIDSLEELKDGVKIVTEPQYFSRLKCKTKQNCLLIGNRDAVAGADAITLTRPLTEQKIERAISEFLRPANRQK